MTPKEIVLRRQTCLPDPAKQGCPRLFGKLMNPALGRPEGAFRADYPATCAAGKPARPDWVSSLANGGTHARLRLMATQADCRLVNAGQAVHRHYARPRTLRMT